MEFLPYILIAIVGLISGIFSGITGGGGAMIMIPAYIFAGLPPQVSVATSKLAGLGGLGFVDFEVSPHTPEDVSVEANKEYAKTASNKLLMLDNNSAAIVKNNHTYLLGGEWA